MFGIDPRAARAVFTAVLVLVALYSLYAIRTTLLLVVIAVLFSYMVYPLVRAGERIVGARVPRDLVIAIAFLLVLGAIALAAGTLGRTFVAEATRLGHELPRLLEPAVLAQRLPLPGWLEPLRERLAEPLRDMISQGGVAALPARHLRAGVITAAGLLVSVIVIPIFSFLMVREAPALQARLRARAGAADRGFWVWLLIELNYLLAQYVRALVALSLAVFVTYATVLTLMRVPFALLLAAAAALLELIPVFGPLVAVLGILSVAVFTGYLDLWWLVVFLVMYRMFQDYVLAPFLMSGAVHVPAIAVVFGILAGAELAGVAGIFLSVPVMAALRIVLMHVRREPVKNAR